MSVFLKPEHLELAEQVVRTAHANNGLAPLDLERFWADQDKARQDPWTSNCPQLPLWPWGGMMSAECIFDELGIEEDWYKLAHDPAWALEMKKRYNDIAERIVGRRLLHEGELPDPQKQWPGVKGLHDIFEGKQEWHSWSYWLMQAADNEAELEALLDRAEKRLENLRDFILPENWDEEAARLRAMGLGHTSPIYRGQRGPITFACSIYGPENLIFLIEDEPELAARFRDLILRAMLERARILDEERGWTPEEAQRGFYWCDDNCCLLNKEMYDFFGKPILQGLFERYSPDPEDLRGQHSDSDMAQHLQTLNELGVNSVNFGPNLTVRQIREAMPGALITGQLAPFTLSRNEEVNIVAETLRDFEMAKEKRGVAFATAGSVNNGSRLSGMRLIMATIQQHCRYENVTATADATNTA